MADIAVKNRNGGENTTIARRELEPFRVMREMLGWDPFREMAPLFTPNAAVFSPAFEVKETKDSFVFKADLPGVQEKDLEVTLTGNRLNVTGKRESEKEQKEETYYTYERTYGSFNRTFTLPDQIDGAHIKAELKAGELTIVVPKTPAAVAKKIPVAGGTQAKS